MQQITDVKHSSGLCDSLHYSNLKYSDGDKCWLSVIKQDSFKTQMSQIWVLCLIANNMMLIKQPDVRAHDRCNEAPMWSLQVNNNNNNYNAFFIKTVINY